MITGATAEVGNLVIGLFMFVLMVWHFATIGHGPIWWAWRFLRRLARHIRLWIWWGSWELAAAEWESPLDRA